MKTIIAILTIVMLTGCSTISHKHVSTRWQGLGVDLEYQSVVAIPPEMIPEFINAVDRLENILNKLEQTK